MKRNTGKGLKKWIDGFEFILDFGELGIGLHDFVGKALFELGKACCDALVAQCKHLHCKQCCIVSAVYAYCGNGNARRHLYD